MPKMQSPTSPLLHLLDFDRFPPSVERLSPVLTMNNISVPPLFRYGGGDASATGWNAWGYGGNLSLGGGAGASPTYGQGSPLLGNSDNSAKFVGTGNSTDTNKNFQVAGNVITTGDIVLEFVLMANQLMVVTGGIVSKGQALVSVGAYDAHIANVGSTNVPYLYLGHGASTNAVGGAALSIGAWYHLMVFVNRDEASTNGSRWYVNGIASGTGANLSARAASLATVDDFCIGSVTEATGAYSFAGNIAYEAGWTRDSWCQVGAAGPAEWATIAANRFAQLIGMYPTQVRGNAFPTTITRANVAYLDRYEPGGYGARKLYQVGSGWLRACDRQNAAGTARLKGVLIEQTAINLTEYSETFGSWSPVNCSATVDGAVAPNGTQTADAMNSGLVTAEHYMQDVNGAATGATKYTGSVWLKQKDGYGWVALRMLINATLTIAYFDIVNGALGTATNSTTGMENWGNGWWRCWITSSTNGDGTAAHLLIYAASGDGTTTYKGTGNDMMYMWGGQMEATAYNLPTSYMPTGAATATRQIDQLAFTASGNFLPTEGTIVLKLMREAASIGGEYIMRIDDLSANNLHFIGAFTAGGLAGKKLIYWIAQGGTYRAQLASAADIIDGAIHEVRCKFYTGYAEALVDNVSIAAPATPSALPVVTTIVVGCNSVTGSPFYPHNGLLSNIRIYGKSRADG